MTVGSTLRRADLQQTCALISRIAHVAARRARERLCPGGEAGEQVLAAAILAIGDVLHLLQALAISTAIGFAILVGERADVRCFQYEFANAAHHCAGVVPVTALRCSSRLRASELFLPNCSDSSLLRSSSMICVAAIGSSAGVLTRLPVATWFCTLDSADC